MAFGQPSATKPVKEEFDVRAIFKPAIELKPSNNFIFGVWGREKVGKTYWCLDVPGTKYIIDTENAVELNKEVFSDVQQSDMFIYNAMHTTEGSLRDIDYDKSIFGLFDHVESLIKHIKDSGEKATIIVDSITDIWDWMGIWLDKEAARKTDGKQMMRTEWGKANGPYMEFLKMLKNAPCDVIVTAKAFPAYGKGGEVLDYDLPKWQKNTPYWILVNLEYTKKGRDRFLRIEGCRVGDVHGTFKNYSFSDIRDHIVKESGIKFVD